MKNGSEYRVKLFNSNDTSLVGIGNPIVQESVHNNRLLIALIGIDKNENILTTFFHEQSRDRYILNVSKYNSLTKDWKDISNGLPLTEVYGFDFHVNDAGDAALAFIEAGDPSNLALRIAFFCSENTKWIVSERVNSGLINNNILFGLGLNEVGKAMCI